MESAVPLILIIFSALFFGSQFVPKKFCKGFDEFGYNISMTAGIVVNALAWFVIMFLEEKMCFSFFPCALGFLAGLVWVSGNLLLIYAVSRIGMSRSFAIINLVSVVSFTGAIIFLGELKVSINVILTAFAGVLIVIAGCIIITMTTSKKEKIKSKKALISAFLSSFFFGLFNIMIMYSINVQGLHVNMSALFLSFGALLGAFIIGFKKIGYWISAPKKWHGLGVSGGVLWGMGNVLSLYAMQKIGVSISVPMIQGFMTIISALWGIAVFRELEDVTEGRRKRALMMFVTGMILTIAGVWVINQV